MHCVGLDWIRLLLGMTPSESTTLIYERRYGRKSLLFYRPKALLWKYSAVREMKIIHSSIHPSIQSVTTTMSS